MPRLFLLALLLPFLVSVAPAQTPSPTPGAVSEPAEEGYLSPSTSLQHFLEVMRAAGPLRLDLYVVGRRHLDLSEIPAVVREERGIALAQQLYEILDSSELNRLEVTAGQNEVTVYRQPSGDGVVLERQPDNRWLFSRETVRSIPRMRAALATKGRITTGPGLTLNGKSLRPRETVALVGLGLPLLSYLAGCALVFGLRVSVGRFFIHRYDVPLQAVKASLRPLGWLMASLVFWIGLCLIPLPSGLLLVLIGLIKVTATLSAVTAAFRISDAASHYVRLLTSRTATGFDDMLVPLARRCFKVLVGTLGVLFLAQNLDIEVWSLFAGFSIFGAMVALAGQDTVKNFFGSLTVLGDRPFGVGDWVVVEGVEGIVEDVGFRSTRIRTFYDSVITLPNSRLITASVDNYGRRKYRRYTTRLAVRWSTSPQALESFCEGVRELVRRHPHTRKDNFQVWVNDVSSYAIEILVYIFFAAPDWGSELRERHRFLIDVHRLAARLGVELAYPTQQLLLSRHEERAQEDYDRQLVEQALSAGREATRALLARTLPSEDATT
jgi:MscS family membrane protein